MNGTGKDNVAWHMMCQAMGQQAVVANRGKLDFGSLEQIFDWEFDERRKKRVLVKTIGE